MGRASVYERLLPKSLRAERRERRERLRVTELRVPYGHGDSRKRFSFGCCMADHYDNESGQKRFRRRRDDRREDGFRVVEEALERLVGVSPGIRTVKEQLRRFAPTEAPVLLLGSTGTGKGLAADIIHRISGRPGSFEPVNCATLTRDLGVSQLFGHRRGAFTGAVDSAAGAVERADLGTLFLDEVTDLPPEVQPALLTVLEDGRYLPLGESKARQSRFRVVAATAKPIEKMVEEGEFRGDLYARLRTCRIRLPDLADRGADVVLIARSLLPDISARMGRPSLRLSPTACAALLDSEWPGNVRDLASVLIGAVLATDDERIEGESLRKRCPATTARPFGPMLRGGR